MRLPAMQQVQGLKLTFSFSGYFEMLEITWSRNSISRRFKGTDGLNEKISKGWDLKGYEAK